MKALRRPWHISDLESMYRHANNPNIAKYMTDRFPSPYTLEAGKKFIEFANAQNNSHLWAIEYNGEAIGGIGLHLQEDVMRKNVEMGYWIGEEHWGKGIMPDVIKETVDWAFANMDVTRVYGRVFGNNPRSAALLEKCGFTKETHLKNTIFKNEEFLDEMIYAIRR